jgi:hypothetical protein
VDSGVPGESMAAAGIAVYLHVRIASESLLNLSLRVDEFILLAQVHQHRNRDGVGFAEVILRAATVISDRTVNVLPRCGQECHQAGRVTRSVQVHGSSPAWAPRHLGMCREAAHASAAVVVHRLVDLGPRVHHKGPLANDRFLDRLPIQDQNRGVF